MEVFREPGRLTALQMGIFHQDGKRSRVSCFTDFGEYGSSAPPEKVTFQHRYNCDSKCRVGMTIALTCRSESRMEFNQQQLRPPNLLLYERGT